MTEVLSNDDLDKVGAWCEHMLERYGLDFKDGRVVCGRNEDLPTGSIRSTIVSLLGEVRKSRGLKEHIESGIKLVYPQDMTPAGKRVLESILEEYE